MIRPAPSHTEAAQRIVAPLVEVNSNTEAPLAADHLQREDYSNHIKRRNANNLDSYLQENEYRNMEIERRTRIVKEQAQKLNEQKIEERNKSKIQQRAYKEELDQQMSDKKSYKQRSATKEGEVRPSNVVLGEREVLNQPEQKAKQRKELITELQKQVEQKEEQKKRSDQINKKEIVTPV